jgi:4-hydroxy-tetrahydrodipicolinate synthase
MVNKDFPAKGMLAEENGGTGCQITLAGHGKFQRREFLAGSATLVGGLTAAVPAGATGPETPTCLPTTATKDNAKKILVGPLIPVITHLKKDLSLDLEAIRSNVNYLIQHGMVTGKGVLLAVGAGGDFDVLSLEERKAVARAIVEAADGRVPVVVGIQDTNLQVCMEMARYAQSLQVYGVQVGPPYYHSPSDEDAHKFFRSIHDACPKIGIMVYNTWWHGYNIPFAVMDKLVNLDRVVSIKWSHPAGPFDYAQGVRRYCDRVAVIDNALMCVLTHLLGGHGFITHLATVWPEHELKIWQLCQSGRYKEAMGMNASDNYLWEGFRGKIAGRTSGESPPVKAALELTGRPGGPSRPPSRDLNQEERAELRALLRSMGMPNVR